MTYILGQIEGGDPSAAVMPLPLVNEELRELAADERSDHTLQATALIHEAYLRLVDAGKAQHWKAFTVSQQPAQAIHRPALSSLLNHTFAGMIRGSVDR